MNWFSYKQEPGQTWNEFVARKRELGRLAQLPTITWEEQLVQNLLQTCIPEIRSKLLELESPDQAALDKTANAWQKTQIKEGASHIRFKILMP